MWFKKVCNFYERIFEMKVQAAYATAVLIAID